MLLTAGCGLEVPNLPCNSECQLQVQVVPCTSDPLAITQRFPGSDKFARMTDRTGLLLDYQFVTKDKNQQPDEEIWGEVLNKGMSVLRVLGAWQVEAFWFRSM